MSGIDIKPKDLLDLINGKESCSVSKQWEIKLPQMEKIYNEVIDKIGSEALQKKKKSKKKVIFNKPQTMSKATSTKTSSKSSSTNEQPSSYALGGIDFTPIINICEERGGKGYLEDSVEDQYNDLPISYNDMIKIAYCLSVIFDPPTGENPVQAPEKDKKSIDFEREERRIATWKELEQNPQEKAFFTNISNKFRNMLRNDERLPVDVIKALIAKHPVGESIMRKWGLEKETEIITEKVDDKNSKITREKENLSEIEKRGMDELRAMLHVFGDFKENKANFLIAAIVWAFMGHTVILEALVELSSPKAISIFLAQKLDKKTKNNKTNNISKKKTSAVNKKEKTASTTAEKEKKEKTKSKSNAKPTTDAKKTIEKKSGKSSKKSPPSTKEKQSTKSSAKKSGRVEKEESEEEEETSQQQDMEEDIFSDLSSDEESSKNSKFDDE